MNDKIKIDILKGKLREWIYYEIKIQGLDSKIKELDDEMCRIKGISYDNVMIENKATNSRELTLLKMIEEKERFEKEKSKCAVRLLTLHKSLRLDVLSEGQLKILKLACNYDSYTKTGKELGVSKDTVYREMQVIFKKLIKYFEV